MASSVSSAVTSAANRPAACRAHRGQVRGERPDLGGQLRLFARPARGSCRCRPRARPAAPRPAWPSPGRPRCPRRAAVGADQPAQRGPAFLDGGQPGRVGVQRLGVGREVRGHIGQQVDGLGQPVGEPGQRPGRARGPGPAPARPCPSRVSASEASRRRRPGRRPAPRAPGGRRVQRVGVGQPLVLGQQRRVLAGHRARPPRSRPAPSRSASASAARSRSARVSASSSARTA